MSAATAEMNSTALNDGEVKAEGKGHKNEVSAKTSQRIQQLLGERRELRAKLNEAEGALANLSGLVEQQRQNAETALAVQVAEFDSKAVTERQRCPDYDQVVRLDGWAPYIVAAIVDSPNGPAIAYAVAKNPQLLANLHRMGEREAVWEIRRGSVRLELEEAQRQAADYYLEATKQHFDTNSTRRR